jgi:hypothetical protein
MSDENRALLILAEIIKQQHDDLEMLIMRGRDGHKWEPDKAISRWFKNKDFVDRLKHKKLSTTNPPAREVF